jgi:hypothetical protein
MSSAISAHLIILLISISSLASLCDSQDARVFPSLVNLAVGRPLTSTPAQASCGSPTPTSYCVSSLQPASITTCIQDSCIQACPYRQALPAFINMLNVSCGLRAVCGERSFHSGLLGEQHGQPTSRRLARSAVSPPPCPSTWPPTRPSHCHSGSCYRHKTWG